jgi:DNA-binding response OmpR family regulator
VQRILVVEDDMQIARTLRDYLEVAGFEVSTVGDGSAAVASARGDKPDLIVLDLGLPGMDGLDVARELRRSSAVPIVMLTARGEEADRIVGLELGADDYVTKPFSPRELATRVRTVLRRSQPAAPPRERVEVGPLVLDASRHEARRDGELLSLTAKEFELLWFLAANPNRVFSRDQLMARVWGYAAALDTGTVTVHVRRLREKLERDPSKPELLETVWGVGYRLRA